MEYRDNPAQERSKKQQASENHQPNIDLQLLLVKPYLRLGVFFLAFFSFTLLSLYSLYRCFTDKSAAFDVGARGSGSRGVPGVLNGLATLS